MQRLYKRRKVGEDGYIKSNWQMFGEISALNGYQDMDDFAPNKGDTFIDIIIEGGEI